MEEKKKKGLGLDGCRVMREGAGKREEGKPLHVVERSEQGEGEGAKMRWKYTSSSPLTVVLLVPPPNLALGDEATFPPLLPFPGFLSTHVSRYGTQCI